MSKLYKRNCNKCGKYYEHKNAKKYCSLICYYSSSERSERMKGNKLGGLKHWKKGEKHWKLSEVTKEKHRLRIGKLSNQWGRNHTESAKLKMSIARRGKRTGELNNFWKGGITPINLAIRTSSKYKEWRFAVFKRDSFTCQECGQIGSKLNADHIKPFSLFPELRFELSNGRTLCINCHRKTNTYGLRVRSYKLSV